MVRLLITKYEMLIRVASFALRTVGLFPERTAAGDLTKALVSSTERLSQAKAAQAAAREQRRLNRTLRLEKFAALRRQVVSIRRTGEALGLGGFPRLSKDPKVSELFDAAGTSLEAAAAAAPQFVLHGHAPDFSDLKSAVDDLRIAIESEVASKIRRKAAVEEFDQTFTEACGYVERFEVLLLNTMSDNTSVMAEWAVFRQVESPRGSKRAAAPAAADASPPAEAPATPVPVVPAPAAALPLVASASAA